MPRFRRIIAGVSGSPRNLPALRAAADLACAFDAVLIPVHAWVPPGSELPDSQFISEHSLREWEQAAGQRLWDALEMAFGGLPRDILTELVIARGKPALYSPQRCLPG
jgi:nucleotide-binding universal stress UspA family protein